MTRSHKNTSSTGSRIYHADLPMSGVFRERLVETYAGGNRRGGASLSRTGQKVLEIYESICEDAQRIVAKK